MIAEGTLIDDRYEVLSRVGAGGMADVYLAFDKLLGRKVAVKVLHHRFAEDQQFVERFRREASSAAALSHPHVVAIFDRGAWDGTFYIAMEYLPGRTLKQLVTEHGPLPPAGAIDIVLQVLRATRFAHRRGVIHRDLKPHNVILDEEGRAKVTDFGIARAGASDMTLTGSIMGTAQYLSPEQAQGLAVTEASDVYAVGVVLYELLTGRVPFDGETAVTIALQHISQAPPPARTINPSLPPVLDVVLAKALAKDPAARYRSAEEMIVALEEVRRNMPEPIGEHARAATASLPGVVQTPPAPAEGAARPAGAGQLVGGSGAGGPEAGVQGVSPPRAQAGTQAGPQGGGQASVEGSVAGGQAGTGGSMPGGHASAGGSVPLGLQGVSPPGVQAGTQSDGSSWTIPPAGPLRALPQGAPPGFEASSHHTTGSLVPVVSDDGGGSHERARDRRRRRLLIFGALAALVVLAGVLIALLVPASSVKVPDVVGRTEHAAVLKLREAGLRAVPTTASNDAVRVGDVISQRPAAGRRVADNAKVRIVVSSGPGDVKVPVVRGLTTSRARAMLVDAGLHPEEKRIASAAVKAGLAVGTRPPASQRVRNNSHVTLLISTGPPLVRVPNVKGELLDEAEETIEGAKLRVGAVRRQRDGNRPAGTVLAQAPRPRAKVPRGQRVRLIVAESPAPEGKPPVGVLVPSVLEDSRAVALARLRAAHFHPEVSEKPVSIPSLAGIVLKQSPPAGTRLAKGRTVKIVIGVASSTSTTSTSTTSTSSTTSTTSTSTTSTETSTTPGS